MISITCNQCKTVLTIDDAFAGGVCRCQHCGTIQTVPAHFKGNAAPAAYVSPSAATAKNLYQNQNAARSQGSGSSVSPSGLDELAQVVASSGLGGSGLTSPGLRSGQNVAVQTQPEQAAVVTPDYSSKRKKSPMIPIAIGGGVAGLAIVAAILFFVMRGGTDATGGGAGGGPGSTPGGTTGSSGPAFCGVPIVASGGVIYVLDRANSIRDQFDALEAATFQSVKSLGPDRKFAVILWNNGGEDVAFPEEGFRNANSDQVDQLQKKLEGVQATGSSGVAGALEAAMARNPGVIILVTAKSTRDLDDKDQTALNNAQDKAGGKVKFYAFVIGGQDNDFLKLFAKTNGGQYRLMSDKDLRNATP